MGNLVPKLQDSNGVSHPLFAASDLPGFQAPRHPAILRRWASRRSLPPIALSFPLSASSSLPFLPFARGCLPRPLCSCQLVKLPLPAGSPSPIASNTMSVPPAPLHLRPNPRSHPLRTATPPFFFLSFYLFACFLCLPFDFCVRDIDRAR